ncbi:MAG: formate hydrogenlyase [Rhodanobacter sp. 68-29]|uniref:formate hydrogenlyase n=1 Tax=Rhodanobacter sp. PCA2 TaxID=2006117 RepID=UPI00086BC0F9|nr:formate hydrogenlyase [Rhodanobacter sp. PCA2]MBA2078411.1 formate hydrogenlyase [Rhodanobacter sp. PCA2]MBN8921459.1 formate hydrogenlyase [Rhodanobacter sp.]ODU75001.1 MAG: formate hydrogenlyase [Rhodanobacter sp. SCN 69-32]OJY61518.1 MAG: formate hydrogenlyase [Rhodanobacter sp. 68-29]
MPAPTFSAQVLQTLAGALLLISFAMLAERRSRHLVTLLIWQGAVLVTSTLLVAATAHLPHLFFSAVLTLVLKVGVLPWILLRLMRRLGIERDNEPLVNVPTLMLVGLGLVIFAFGLAQPVTALATTVIRQTLGIALAVILLALLMILARRKAFTQVIGFLALENGLFFAATTTTYGMPMVVELGIALDVLVGVFIFGVFFFHIREQFDSLDLHHLESLKED